jgi:putative tryptophan/tyrosine transport system substrate-binding protein
MDRRLAYDQREEMIMWWRTVGCIVMLTLSLLAAPLAATAQQMAPIPRIGILQTVSPPPANQEAFRHGLRDLGYVVGQNVVIEERDAAGDPTRLPALAAELVQLPVAVLFTIAPAALQAAQQATATIPIVAHDLESDPVQSGFAASLARPGGTITGVFLDAPGLVGKWLELLKEVRPQLARVAVLWDPTTGAVQRDAAHAAARLLAIELHTLEVRTDAAFAPAFLAATQARPDAMLVLGSPLMRRHSQVIADFAVHSRLPVVSPFRDFAEAGGLMAYGPALPATFWSCGVQVGKILQGAKPGDLAMERPVRFALVLNLRTAKALGLTIPPTLLVLADEVIQ